MRRAVLLLLVLAALAGCGSTPAAQLPPPADPAFAPAPVRVAGRTLTTDRAAGALVVDGRRVRVPGLLAPDGIARADANRVLVVDARARRLVLLDARTLRPIADAPAGVGPTGVAGDGRRFFYVADTAGDALLVFALRGAALDPVRYVHLPGTPAAMALDRRRRYRVWVALAARDEVVGLPAHGRPRVVERYATVRGPRALAVDPSDGRLTVTGRDAVQVIPPP